MTGYGTLQRIVSSYSQPSLRSAVENTFCGIDARHEPQGWRWSGQLTVQGCMGKAPICTDSALANRSSRSRRCHRRGCGLTRCFFLSCSRVTFSGCVSRAGDVFPFRALIALPGGLRVRPLRSCVRQCQQRFAVVLPIRSHAVQRSVLRSSSAPHKTATERRKEQRYPQRRRDNASPATFHASGTSHLSLSTTAP